MSEFKGTAGTWRYSESSDTFGCVWSGAIMIADAAPNSLSPEEQRLNGKLLAASKDLLEALQYARRMMKPDSDTAFVDAAINKAIGGGDAK